MQNLLEKIVKKFVTKPEAVIINDLGEAGFCHLQLTVDPTDMGLVIGKEGKTIRALRSLLRVKATMTNQQIYLELIEPQGDDVKLKVQN